MRKKKRQRSNNPKNTRSTVTIAELFNKKMSDSLAVVANFQQNNQDGGERNSENLFANIPQNDDMRFLSQQQSPTHTGNSSSNNEDDDNRTTAAVGQESSTNSFFSGSIGMFRVSRLYCIISTILALIAIVLTPIPIHKIEYHDLATMMLNLSEDKINTHSVLLGFGAPEIHKAEAPRNILSRSHAIRNEADSSQWKWRRWVTELVDDHHNKSSRKRRSANFMSWKKSLIFRQSSDKTSCKYSVGNDDNILSYVKRLMKRINMKTDAKRNVSNSDDCKIDMDENGRSIMHKQRDILNEEWQWIDPIFWEYGSFSHLVTNIIDKILKSTICLCIITNFWLCSNILLHSVVASWFLSQSGSSETNNNPTATRRQHETRLGDDTIRMVPEWRLSDSSGASNARERMGGFLIFKLLLISAVLTPDTLNLMILVSWFTLLSCLRSLDHLAYSTNIHLVATGQAPNKGIIQLLFWVLACDIVAAGSCAALFHTAGLGMILLLTCDCALLGTDTASHILNYYQSVLENSHDNHMRDLEEEQSTLHRANEDGSVGDNTEEGVEVSTASDGLGIQEQPLSRIATMSPTELRQESGRLDYQMECLELAHSRRLSILDTGIFCLDMTCHILTVAHFCHIWIIHGVQFTLIDGVLALHLHSAISTACTKLVRRQNIHKIARDLEGKFPNATDEELKQAATDGDVCCICLMSMTKGGNIKKLPCGHIYHTHCLREVIERAQNLESAKCPLCRAPLVGDHCSNNNSSGRNTNHNNNFRHRNNHPNGHHAEDLELENRIVDSEIETDDRDVGDTIPVREVEGERALFRFSTEGILPAWLPLPAFSFEVVRRPPVGIQRTQHSQNQEIQTAAQISDSTVINDSNNEEANSELQAEYPVYDPQLQQLQDTEVPFFRRILLLMGLVPMSPEEEARALEQLVDMFPQYERRDLYRELQNRGSPEAATEAILMGVFPGNNNGE